MTAPMRTVSQHLRRAQRILEKKDVSTDDLIAINDCLEKALDTIQFARNEAVAAMDKF